MMFYKIVGILLCVCLICIPGIKAGNDAFANEVIEVHTSPYMYVYNTSSVQITARDPITGNPYTSGTTDITIFIQQPDGSMLINGSHPTKFIDGIYQKEFSVQCAVGTYLVWAILNVSGTEYWGATLFELRWSPYTNITGAKYELENIVSLFNWLSRNNTKEIISHISNLNEGISLSQKETEKAGIFETIQKSMISLVITWIFLICAMLFIFMLGTWIYGRKKATKLALRVSNVPEAIIATVSRRTK
jgi:hypothetical protein